MRPSDDPQPTTRAEIQAAAEAAAEARGRAAATVEAKFEEHGREISYLKGAVTAARRDITALEGMVRDFSEKFTTHIQVSDALAEQLEKQRDNQVSKKTYILGLVGAVIALGMLLIAGIALIHGGGK